MKSQSLILFALLCLVPLSCNGEGPHESQEVVSTLVRAISDRTLPERKQFYDDWALGALIFSRVSFIESEGTYEVTVRPDPYEPVREIWGVDMDTGSIWPIDSAAVLSAILFFCVDRDDTDIRCKSYFLITDKIVDALENR